MDLKVNFSKIEDAANKFKSASQNISDGTQGNQIGNYLNNPVVNNLKCAPFLRSLGGRFSSNNNDIEKMSESIADIRRKIESVDKTPDDEINLLLVENQDYFVLYDQKLLIIKEKMNDVQENLNRINKIYVDRDPSEVILFDGKTLKDYNDLQQKYINQYKILFKERAFTSKYCMNESLDAWRTTDRDIKNIILEVSESWPKNISQNRVDVIIQAGNMIWKGITYSQELSQPDALNPEHLDCSDYVSVVFRRAGYDLWKTGSNNCYTGSFIIENGTKRSFGPLGNGVNASLLSPCDVGLMNGSMNGGNANHIGLYIGRNQEDEFVWFHCTGGGPQYQVGNNDPQTPFTYFRKFIEENALTNQQ